jgi:hypothetical protein
MKKRILLNLFFTGILSFTTVLAQNSGINVSKVGTTAGTFLEISQGASATGMGGASVSRANDATVVYWNPAGIAGLDQYEVDVSHTEWLAQTNLDFAALVLPLGEFGTLGFSYTSLSMPDMKVRTVDQPEGTGEYFSAGDLAFGVSYARNLSERFAVGFTAKYIQETIWHMSSSAFAVDVGTIFRTDLFGGMVIGASISNFGSSMKLQGIDTRTFSSVDPSQLGTNNQIPYSIDLDSWNLPLLFRIGVSTNAIKTEDYRWTVAVDALHPNDNYESLNVGTEFSYKESIFLRVGYQSLFLTDHEGGLSFGVGLNSKMLFSTDVVKFDYAYRDFGRLNGVNVFSVGVNF